MIPYISRQLSQNGDSKQKECKKFGEYYLQKVMKRYSDSLFVVVAKKIVKKRKTKRKAEK
ncbi:MAG: hypothetical protein ACI4FZ_05010 [Lachnospiraceae bacterium]